MVTNEEALKQIKNIRVQVREEGGLSHTKVEFVNGSMVCSCGMTRGEAPMLGPDDPVCVCGVELSQHHQSDPMHNFVDAEHYNSHG